MRMLEMLLEMLLELQPLELSQACGLALSRCYLGLVPFRRVEAALRAVRPSGPEAAFPLDALLAASTLDRAQVQVAPPPHTHTPTPRRTHTHTHSRNAVGVGLPPPPSSAARGLHA
jgi:hypothetical protein